MKKERFDYICSIGSSCLCATSLRDAGLRLSSGPFDWILGPGLKERVNLICNDFAGWFEQEDFIFTGNPNRFDHDSYKNVKTGYVFPHDFDIGRDFKEIFPAIREKYMRRIARFYQRISESKRVLLVWLENPIDGDSPSDEDVATSHKILAAKFPDVSIEFLIVDRAPEGCFSNKITKHNGYWRATCKYYLLAKSPKDRARPWDIDTRPIMELLSNFSTKDYRSDTASKKFAKEKRQAKYAELGVHNAVGYAVARIQVKLCKLLLNRMRRRGVNTKRIFEAQFMGLK